MPKRPWCIPNITNMNTILRCIATSCTSKSHLNHIQNVKTTLIHSKHKPSAALPESLRCTLRPTCVHVATLVAARGKNLHEHLPLRRPEICSSSNHGETSPLLKSKLIKLLAASFWKKGRHISKHRQKITTCTTEFGNMQACKKLNVPPCCTVSPGYSFVWPWSSKLHW